MTLNEHNILNNVKLHTNKFQVSKQKINFQVAYLYLRC